MKYLKSILAAISGLLLVSVSLFAQSGNSLSLTLVDESTAEPVGFATVSLQAKGAKKPTAYSLTSDKGKATLSGFREGTYTVKAELLGYETFVKEVTIKGALNLGTVKLKTDKQPMNPLKISYPLLHSSYERRQFFKFMETMPSLTDKSLSYGYGTPFKIAYRVQNELVLYFYSLREEKPDADAEFAKFEGRYFSTPKKMGAQTAEANTNAGLAAANQIVGFIKEGITKFQVNK